MQRGGAKCSVQASFLLWWQMFSGTSSFLCILIQFLASTSRKLCCLPAGESFTGQKMDWSLIRNSVLALYFLCLISTNTLSPRINHTVKKDRHRRQTRWRKFFAWCSNLVFLLRWDGLCVLEIDFRSRKETFLWCSSFVCFYVCYSFTIWWYEHLLWKISAALQPQVVLK